MDDETDNVWETYDYEEWYHQTVYQRRVNLINYLLKPVIKKQDRRWDVHPILQNRLEQGDYNNLIEEMRLTDTDKYYNYMRMTPEMFDISLSHVGPLIAKNANYRDDVIWPGQRLALTLRYLASGDSMVSLSYAFRIGKSTVSTLIRQTCLAIWDSLRKTYLMKPSVEKFKAIADEFENLWNMPHCTGALDGKHVAVQAFSQSWSENYNYKNFHSLVLLASCDANYNFILVDVGAEGRNSDGGIFRASDMGKALENGSLQFPGDTPIGQESGQKIPYFMVADEAFPLKTYMMRPYPGRSTGTLPLSKAIFNYRLSRARRCIENAFGIMVGRFRIFRKPIIASKETVQGIMLSSVVLHNFIKSFDDSLPEGDKRYAPPSFFDREDANGIVILGEWRNNSSCFSNLEPEPNDVQQHLSSQEVRNHLKSYFLNEGAVPWQQESVFFGQH